MVQFLHPNMTPGKSTALTLWIFVSKVISLLFNMLSRFVVASSKGQASFNFMAAVTICSDFGAQKNKICHWFYFFPFYLPWSNEAGCRDFSCLNVEFQGSFFTLIKRLCSSSSLSVIRGDTWGCWFFSQCLIPTCDSSSLAFLMIHSEYKLNKPGDSIQPYCAPFPILNQFFNVPL